MRAANCWDEIDRLIQKIDRLHSAPKVAQKILLMTRTPDFNLQEVVGCLECDPALSAKVLSVVNSSRYGLAHRIGSIQYAATYLGRRSLRLLVLTFALADTLMQGKTNRLYTDYWRRAITMATVASQLSKKHSDIADDDAYTAGLLADVGVLALAQFYPLRYLTIYDTVSHGFELIEAEQQEFGFHHPMLGARLLEHWGLPITVVEAVANHHDVSLAPNPLEPAVRAGDLMAEVLWVPNSPHVKLTQIILKGHFGIDLDGFIDLATLCRYEIEENTQVFGLDTKPSVNCEELLEEARRLYTQASLEAALELDNLEASIEDLSSN